MMSSSHVRHASPLAACLAATVALALTGCRQPQSAAGLATPSVALAKDTVPLGGPLEATYRFVVADSTRFDERERVMVHFLDADGEFMWADDFDPPTPTTEWRPGQTVEFTRTSFVPMYPYVGDATMQIALYSPASGERVPLSGDNMGQLAYRAATLHVLPQTSSILTVYKEGWHGVESPPEAPGDEWQWSRKDGVLAFKNPHADAVLLLDLDNPSEGKVGPQQVTVSAGDTTLMTFMVTSTNRLLQKIPMSVAQLGSGETVELHVVVDKTFVPAEVDTASQDTRELGVRVFHAYVDRQS
jgi:hypothetical protein